MTDIRVAILTLSDRSARGERPDESGPALVKAATGHGWVVTQTALLPDSLPQICEQLITWSDSGTLDLILTTGGTGFAPRDITPEATRQVLERLTPGLDEAMRAASLRVTPHAMLSRGVSGIRRRTLIVNLPGSPRAALENLQVIAPVLPHAIALLQEDSASEQGHRTA